MIDVGEIEAIIKVRERIREAFERSEGSPALEREYRQLGIEASGAGDREILYLLRLGVI